MTIHSGPQVTPQPVWGVRRTAAPTTDDLDALLRDEIPAIVVPELVALADRRRIHDALARRAGAPTCDDDALAYPFERVAQCLADAWEPGVRAPYRGQLELVLDEPLDVDFAPRHGRLAPDGLREQLQASIALRPGPADELTVYGRRWRPDDAALMEHGEWNPWTVITGVPFCRLHREEGALVLTSARNFRAGPDRPTASGTLRFAAGFAYTADDAPLVVLS